MSELVFLKLGGSLLTDKTREKSFRREECRRLGAEIKAALASSSIRLLLGHGAGSFGHFAAQRHNVAQGLPGGGGCAGYAETRRSVIELNRLVLEAFADADFHPISISPSSCAQASRGSLQEMDTAVIEALLRQDQSPLVFGDAIVDDHQGFTICSTEVIFRYLADRLGPTRVLVACDVDGVFVGGAAGDPAARMPLLTHRTIPAAIAEIRRGDRADVTGGMAGKLEALAEMAALPSIAEIRIFSGLVPGAVRSVLLGEYDGGTVVTGDRS